MRQSIEVAGRLGGGSSRPECALTQPAAGQRAIWAACAVGALLLACTSGGPPPAPAAAAAVPDLEQRALVMLLEDRRLWEGFTLESARRAGVEARRSLALALGRLADRRGQGPLLELLRDPEPAVRRAAAFSLWGFADAMSRDALRLAVGDADRAVGVEAVRSLARRGASVSEVGRPLAELPAEELWSRLLPSLALFAPQERLATAQLALSQESDESLRRLAALALAHRPREPDFELLAELASDPDPWVRGASLRSLGRSRQAEHTIRVATGLGDESGWVRIQALTALSRQLAEGWRSAPSELLPQLVESFDHPMAGVRLRALEVAAHWLLEPSLELLLQQRFADSARASGERCAALWSLVIGGAPAGGESLVEAASAKQPALRACAAEVAPFLGAAEMLAELAQDREPRVRSAVLRARARAAASFTSLAREVRQDPSPLVRSLLYELLVRRPVLSAEELLGRSLEGEIHARFLPRVEPDVAARVGLLRALASWGREQRMERGAVILLLESAAQEDPARPARLEAAHALAELGQEPPPISAVRSLSGLGSYREAVLRTTQPRVVRFETEAGDVRIRLACPQAPRTCLNLLQLIAQGFYDGLELYDGVPGEEIRTGDPTATGHGGAGYYLRDEVTPLSFERAGVVVMERPFADGIGSRLAITLSPQPWRTGAEVAVGHVIAGLDVLERAQVGDRILRALVEESP